MVIAVASFGQMSMRNSSKYILKQVINCEIIIFLYCA